MIELKTCPFCGCGDGSLYIVTVEQHGYETVGIFCNACKQTVTLEYNEWEGLSDKTKEKAIKAWNRREAPSAQPKQGQWIEHKWADEVNEMLVSNYECSECHHWERYDSNFCPNCGAKMEGVKECVDR